MSRYKFRKMNTSKILIVLLASILSLDFAVKAKEGSVFTEDAPLNLTLEADLVAIINDKSEDPEYTPARLIQNHEGFKISAFEIKVKPRGNTRRVTSLCDFPPLKFNFKKKQLANTAFEGQDKIKFVSQCRQEDDFQKYVLEEYLLYKTYNLLTEESYRTRLVNITIKDFKLRVPTLTMTGFLIEDDDALAERLTAKKFENVLYSQDSCEVSSVDRLSMFQYMIGNTDWYINTKHNTDVFQVKSDNSLIPVPFDFDFSGVINTIYAIPSKEIPITQVKQRYFKGSCRDDEAYDETIQLFNEKMESIYALYNSFEMLPKSTVKKHLKYYSKFYKIINDDELADASFYSVCNSNIPKLRASK